MQRSLVWVGLLVSACADRGTLAYSDSAGIHLVDIGGDDTVLDHGSFGGLAISGDGRHVAYQSKDQSVRVASADGVASYTVPVSFGPLSFGPGSSLQYVTGVDGTGRVDTAFLPGPGGDMRVIPGDVVAVSPDVSFLVYHQQLDDILQPGNLMVENLDGSDPHMIAAGIAASQITFMPDQQHVLVRAFEGGAHAVLEIGLTDGSVAHFGQGQIPASVPGGSLFLGSEVLLVHGTELVALDLGDGTYRHFADEFSDVKITHAAFIDHDRVLYARDEGVVDLDQVFDMWSVRIADGTHERVLAQGETGVSCDLVGMTSDVAGVDCAAASMIAFDTTVRATAPHMHALGITPDGNGLVASADDGAVLVISGGGDARTIATALATGDQVVPPFVAYAP